MQVTALGNPDGFRCDPDGGVRVAPLGVQVSEPFALPQIVTNVVTRPGCVRVGMGDIGISLGV
jgi:hypothetical protein